MNSSAEQIHNKAFNIAPQKGKDERIFLDLDICSSKKCETCTVQCSYFYHPGNNGVRSIVELATYALVCRRCKNAHCIAACPVDALEQQPEKNWILVRHNMRCISCKSCSHACPYGTIYPENVPLLIHNCDFCLDRRDKANEPLCTKTCPHGALSVKKADGELDANTFLVGDNLIVHSTHWAWEKA
ncbi:MAG: 4Fe-4S binding protein [Candidatus Omnitrophica bacterium]|nr:4Fe-4S binding protein [Candidatus Omnitrophota bacterium]